MIPLSPGTVLAQSVFLWVLPGYNQLHISGSRLRSLGKNLRALLGMVVCLQESGGKGYVSHWQRHFVMNLACHITFLIFKSSSPVQAGESFSGRESLTRLLLASKLEQLWLCLSPNGKLIITRKKKVLTQVLVSRACSTKYIWFRLLKVNLQFQ